MTTTVTAPPVTPSVASSSPSSSPSSAPSPGTSSVVSLAPTLGRRDRGQATTEYALVMLAAALVALLVVAWATAGGGAGKIGELFDRILDTVMSKV